VVNIKNFKSDTMDEKLRVMFLLLSLTIYTNSLMEFKLFHQYACFVSHDFISLPNDPFLDLKDIMPNYFRCAYFIFELQIACSFNTFTYLSTTLAT